MLPDRLPSFPRIMLRFNLTMAACLSCTSNSQRCRCGVRASGVPVGWAASCGDEWRLHRHWFDHSAIGNLLGSDSPSAEQYRLCACHDKLLKHKCALFDHLTERWRDLFDAKYEVLLYDLTSTYFESDPPDQPTSLRRFGYSRDKRSDCVQVVISFLAYALQVTLKTRLKRCAKGFTPRSALEKSASLQMLDVHLPTSNGREIIMTRYTHPEKDLQLILDQLKLTLPEQAPPRITAPKTTH